MLASNERNSKLEPQASEAFTLANGFNLPLQTKPFQPAQKPTQQSARRARARAQKERKAVSKRLPNYTKRT
jgi:hypothetical protein